MKSVMSCTCSSLSPNPRGEPGPRGLVKRGVSVLAAPVTTFCGTPALKYRTTSLTFVNEPLWKKNLLSLICRSVGARNLKASLSRPVISLRPSSMKLGSCLASLFKAWTGWSDSPRLKKFSSTNSPVPVTSGSLTCLLSMGPLWQLKHQIDVAVGDELVRDAEFGIGFLNQLEKRK